jgi:hypothetical protein
VIDKRTPGRKKYVKTVRDRNTAADIAEAGAAGDDDDEEGRSEESESEHEDEDGEGGGGQRTQLQKTETHTQRLLHNRNSEEDRVEGGRFPELALL